GGMAWSLGYADGEHAPLAEILAAIRRITRAAAVPVTVDFEAGYGDTPATVATHVRNAIEAGVAGLNLEDGVRHTTLRPLADAAARIAAAREAAQRSGVPIFINARVDTYMVPWHTGEAERIEETVRRANAYLAAGADGIYPIGASDPALLKTLFARIDAPVNVAAQDGLPSLTELAKLGVARVTTATRLATLAYAAARDAAARIKASGEFTGLATAFGYADLQKLFPHA
ncbi:MAG TPA: isocitrate lyase/phosphoenolpyruvate mutase family protein, partial [Rhodanobacter sp.]|nr:isocitrate lyase/phosphoenolpyruvate mutase family protein [Rhodanobacter sp.]